MCCDVRQAHKTTVQATSNRQIIASLLFDFDMATLQVTGILRLRFVAFVLRTRLSEPVTAQFQFGAGNGNTTLALRGIRAAHSAERTRYRKISFGAGNGNTTLTLRGVRATHSAERTRYRTISFGAGNGNTALALRGVRAAHSAERTRYRTISFGAGNGNTTLALRGVRAAHSAERTRYRKISFGAGNGNRTRNYCLGSSRFATKLYPQNNS